MKIAVNKCFGGFGVSKAVHDELGLGWEDWGFLANEDFGIVDSNRYAYRVDPRLIAAIEKVGNEAASTFLSKVEIVEIPDDVEWEIEDYDGMETIHEKHRSW